MMYAVRRQLRSRKVNFKVGIQTDRVHVCGQNHDHKSSSRMQIFRSGRSRNISTSLQVLKVVFKLQVLFHLKNFFAYFFYIFNVFAFFLCFYIFSFFMFCAFFISFCQFLDFLCFLHLKKFQTFSRILVKISCLYLEKWLNYCTR